MTIGMRRFSIAVMFLALVTPFAALAHGDTAAEVEAGRALDQSLQSGTKKCAELADNDFEVLGEFFMDRMMGESHESMNGMMKQTLGEKGEEQMHEVMGKRMSGCDASAQMPEAMMSGMMGMMGSGGMMGGEGMMGQGGMMNAQNVSSTWGAMLRGVYPIGFAALWYAIGVLGVVALALVIIKYCRELINKK